MINDRYKCRYKCFCLKKLYLFAFSWVSFRCISFLKFHLEIYTLKFKNIYILIVHSFISLCTRQALKFANLSTVFSVDKFTKWRHSALFEQEIINAVQLHGLYLKFISFCVIIPCAMTSWTTCAFRQPLTVLYRGKAENINVEKISLIFLATTAF